MSAVHSSLYFGRLRHRRRVPRPHAFCAPMFLAYLDLEELPDCLDPYWFWSARRRAPMAFHREDYLGPAGKPLDEAVRQVVESRLGRRPGGPVRMLANLRTFGRCFNPLTLYYCFDQAGRPDAVAAEVTNTPWGERHVYVLDARGVEGGVLRTKTSKELHVSPFMDMDYEYLWRVEVPSSRLRVAIVNRRPGAGGADFVASMDLRRRPLSSGSLAAALASHPLMSLEVLGRIYWQALRLWLKGTPYVPHPAWHRTTTSAPEPPAAAKPPHGKETWT